MGQIKLLSQNIHKHTLINNLFIDTYMPSANGDYVKVYIYLLRLVLSNQTSFTSSTIAKQLNLIESDVVRALKYWDELKVLEVHIEDGKIKDIGLLSLEKAEETIAVKETTTAKPMKHKEKTGPAKLYSRPEYSMDEMALITEESEFKQLIYITSKYLGKQLTQTDVNTLLGFVDWLGLPFDVVEFLIEYCASGGHRHMNYIEKVAISWSDENIKTIEQAKVLTENFSKNYYRIFKALGISNRQPTGAQVKLMDKWIDDYNFAIEVIEKACDKTIAAINKPELKYVDTILSRWHDHGAKSVIDIDKLDATYQSNKKAEREAKGKIQTTTDKRTSNRFHNHEQRDYDYSLLEKKMDEMIDTEVYEKRS